jgi:hypothetical protein
MWCEPRSSSSAARGDIELAPSCDAGGFVDHVGRLEYRGLDGVERSTRLYRALIDDLAFTVLDQIAEGDRVETRFALTGSSRGRRLRLEAITLSRLRDGRTMEGLIRVRRARAAPPARLLAHAAGRPATAPGGSRGAGQRRFVALIVAPIAPNVAALRRVSSNVDRCPRTSIGRRCRSARLA